MTIDDLCAHMISLGYKFARDGLTINVSGDLDLDNLTTLPGGVNLSAGGYLDLRRLTTLPKDVTLSAGGNLYLGSLITLPEGVTLSAGRDLDLGSLTTLREGVTLSAGEDLDLQRLTTLPEGVTLSATGYLDLRSVTALREGVTLSAGENLDLSGLTADWQNYGGERIRLRMIDGFATRLISSRDGEGVTLWSAQFFRGHLDTDPRCFVAQTGDIHAHGDTAAEALRDLRFKIAQVNLDPTELADTIRKRGTVTFDDYRLLTGACESGLREGLRARGIDPEVEELPLKTVLALSKNAYGGAQFAKAVG